MNSESKDMANLFKHCFIIPKVELHAHLTGSVRHRTILELLADEDDKNQFAKLINGKLNVYDCFKVFGYIYKILTNLEVVIRITKEMLQDFNKQNCLYLEIRTNIPHFSQINLKMSIQKLRISLEG